MKSLRIILSGRWTAALVVGLLVAGGVAAQSPPAAKAAAPAQAAKPAKKSVEPAFKMVLEPRAMELLKATSARLAAAKSMSFTATVNYEYPSQLGPPIAYTMRYDVTHAAAGQAQGGHARRRPGVRVLLRRQGDDGVRACRESGRGRRCARRRSMRR